MNSQNPPKALSESICLYDETNFTLSLFRD